MLFVIVVVFLNSWMNKLPPSEGWPNFGIIHSRKWRGPWKAGTYIISGIIGYYMIFHTNYDIVSPNDRNVFTSIRKWHQRQINRFFGIDPPSVDNIKGNDHT